MCGQTTKSYQHVHNFNQHFGPTNEILWAFYNTYIDIVKILNSFEDACKREFCFSLVEWAGPLHEGEELSPQQGLRQKVHVLRVAKRLVQLQHETRVDVQ